MSPQQLCLVYSLLLGWCSVLGQLSEKDVEERERYFADMMKYDGVERLVSLTSSNINKYAKKPRLVVLFHAQKDPNLVKQEKQMLEVVAKVFDGKEIIFAESNVLRHQEVAELAGVRFVGVIKIFNHGKISDYLGQRTADVMVPYFSKLFENPLIEVDSKVRKKQFEQLDLPKVIAFVRKNSKELKQLESASRAFQPMIPFYVTYSIKFAKALDLKRTNSLLFIKPHEKPLAFGSKDSFLDGEITSFVNQNRRQVMRKLRLENLHDVWAADREGLLIPVFARSSGKDGPRFLSVARKVAREFTNSRLEFVWIDPEPFQAMQEHWRQTFQIDPMQPSIGAVDVSKQTSAWLQMSTLTGKNDAIAKDIRRWLTGVLSGEVTLQAIKSANVTSTPNVREEL